MIAILEAKDLNKISLVEICGSLFTYEQEVNQIDEEEKMKVVEKKERPSLKNELKGRENVLYFLWRWRGWNNHDSKKTSLALFSTRSKIGSKKKEFQKRPVQWSFKE